MRTKESWAETVSAAAHLGAEGELERKIGQIQSDARADLEAAVKELEKDKARLDWLLKDRPVTGCTFGHRHAIDFAMKDSK